MKSTFILAILTTFILNLNAQVTKNIKAEIQHVTVFPDRAQIGHEASVTMMPGKTVFRLAGLSPYIDPQSIQVKGYGEFTLLSVNHQNNYLDSISNAPDIIKAGDQIEALRIKIEDEKAALNVLKEKEAFIIANRAILVVKDKAYTPEQVKALIDLYNVNVEQISLTTLKKTRQIKEYEQQIDALQQQISGNQGRTQLPSGEILVSVSSEKQSSGKLTFSYNVSNAGWYPSYDIRIQDIKNPVTIFYKANVYQNSGVAWKDVKLTFSNATPWISGDIPVLYPWFIDYYNPVVVTAYGIKRSKAPVMAEVANAPEAKSEDFIQAEAVPVMVEKNVGATTITFDLSVPYTIPSDGKMQTIEIQRLTAPADYKYVALPKLSQQAYLTANITDWSKLSLQSGEATLYFENSFVGKSNLDVNQLTDTFSLSLGTDNSILVKREKRTDFTSRKTIGSNKTETYSFLITVRNNKAAAVKMSLKDQIPVSSNSGITVEALELSGGRHNEQTGEIKWDLDIKPQETKQIVLTYSVKYPKDKTIILE